MNVSKLQEILTNNGFDLYLDSLRSVKNLGLIGICKKNNQKFVLLFRRSKSPELSINYLVGDQPNQIEIFELNWKNYLAIRKYGFAPSICDKNCSFGSGDRLGLVTSPQLQAAKKYKVFPIIAQQSPRELEKTERTFKVALLDAVLGYIESGYTGAYGSDADHIKNRKYLDQAIEAGYTMYTLDLSEWLIKPEDVADISKAKNALSSSAKKILKSYQGFNIKAVNYTLNDQALLEAAIAYDKAIRHALRFVEILKKKIKKFDLEISVDEYPRDTTLEDHLFVVAYLKLFKIKLHSIALKFPGEFQKAVDYRGDKKLLRQNLEAHAALTKQLGGYRLSLHSGSDKFSIYNLFAQKTAGFFHIKTSGTSWLRACEMAARFEHELFNDMYQTCRKHLAENKKSYHVSITDKDFPAKLPKDVMKFFLTENVQQLFHISYGTLLHKYKSKLLPILLEKEKAHYSSVTNHILKHYQKLFAK